jgi:hypothetical protein
MSLLETLDFMKQLLQTHIADEKNKHTYQMNLMKRTLHQKKFKNKIDPEYCKRIIGEMEERIETKQNKHETLIQDCEHHMKNIMNIKSSILANISKEELFQYVKSLEKKTHE